MFKPVFMARKHKFGKASNLIPAGMISQLFLKLVYSLCLSYVHGFLARYIEIFQFVCHKI